MGYIFQNIFWASAAFRLLPTLGLLLGFSACTFTPIQPPEQSYPAKEKTIKDSKTKDDIALLKESMKEPLSPENTSELLDEVGSNWLYGQGMGETAVTVGTIAAFPPYALWVLGNAALQLSGEEPIEVANILPEEGGEAWRTAYSELTSIPGRTSAAVAREDYRDQEVAREKIQAVIQKDISEKKKFKSLTHAKSIKTLRDENSRFGY